MDSNAARPDQPEPPGVVAKQSTTRPPPENAANSARRDAGAAQDAVADLQQRVDGPQMQTNGTNRKASWLAELSKDMSPPPITSEHVPQPSTPDCIYTYEAYILRPHSSNLGNYVSWSYKIERLHLDEAALQAHTDNLGPGYDIISAMGALLPEQIRLIQEGIKLPSDRIVSAHFGPPIDMATQMGNFQIKPVIFVIRTTAPELGCTAVTSTASANGAVLFNGSQKPPFGKTVPAPPTVLDLSSATPPNSSTSKPVAAPASPPPVVPASADDDYDSSEVAPASDAPPRAVSLTPPVSLNASSILLSSFQFASTSTPLQFLSTSTSAPGMLDRGGRGGTRSSSAAPEIHANRFLDTCLSEPHRRTWLCEQCRVNYMDRPGLCTVCQAKAARKRMEAELRATRKKKTCWLCARKINEAGDCKNEKRVECVPDTTADVTE